MHLVQRLYQGVIMPMEIDRRVLTGVVPALRIKPGFMGYMTVDFGGGVFASYTAYAEQAQSEEVLTVVPGVVRTSLADLIPRAAEVTGGNVLRHHRGPSTARVMVMRSYDGCPDLVELDRRIATRLLPRFAALPGFHGYMLLDAGRGQVLSLNLFGTPDDAEVLNGLAAPLVRQHLADLLPAPPETRMGRVLSEIRE